MPKDLIANTAGGTMTLRKLNALERKIRSLRAGRANVRRKQLVSLAQSLGRRKSDRGKEPTYESIVFSNLRPMTIPSHPGSMPPFTVESILDQAEGEDIPRWRDLLERSQRTQTDPPADG